MPLHDFEANFNKKNKLINHEELLWGQTNTVDNFLLKKRPANKLLDFIL